jgi:hypothetical protein
MILNWQVSLANYMMMRINEFQQIKSTGSIALNKHHSLLRSMKGEHFSFIVT